MGGRGSPLRTQAPQEVHRGAMSIFLTCRPHACTSSQAFQSKGQSAFLSFPFERDFISHLHLAMLFGVLSVNRQPLCQGPLCVSLSPKPLTGVILFSFPDKGQLKWKSLETYFSLHLSSSSWPVQQMGTVPVMGTLH